MAELTDSIIESLIINGSQDLIPSGCICILATNTIPDGWLICDGQAVSRTLYASLFSIIGTIFGEGDGSTTFNLPNLKQKFPLGSGNFSIGTSGGNINHTHDLTHSHSLNNHTHSATHKHILSHTHSAGHTHQSQGHGHGFGSHEHIFYHTQYDTTSGPNSSSGGYYFVWGTSCMGSHTHICHYGYKYANLLANTNSSPTVSKNSTSTSTQFSDSLESQDNVMNLNTSSQLTSASNISVTDSNNPPFLSLNYIIKA